MDTKQLDSSLGRTQVDETTEEKHTGTDLTPHVTKTLVKNEDTASSTQREEIKGMVSIQQSISSETGQTSNTQCEKRRRLSNHTNCAAAQIESLHEQLLKLQSHALHLESELSKARTEMDRLRAGAAAAAAAHAKGRCSCQRLGGLNGELMYCSHCNEMLDGCPKCVFGPTVTGQQHSFDTPDANNDDSMFHSDWEENKEKRKKSKTTTDKGGQSRYWSPEEHKLFLEALSEFGHRDLRAISTYVGTRSMVQCRTHLQKYFMKLAREAKRSTSQQHLQSGQSFGLSI
ncbi:myb domain-containing protein [Galdieria sulphuraria]|uniref:Myb domain-containing protein n=1 Tax=Galdieria sulphuraria TaxID=130081 RepID=M2XJK5_GALSU|nr:myb domain-containing protein [Galdieria sulphuraria]EME30297.1 myb domain-containing protein [Galdieria sulphuraria]|eukprot:XP_005706817.1 myb domain-containing protein [Galdieria sulphuraria]